MPTNEDYLMQQLRDISRRVRKLEAREGYYQAGDLPANVAEGPGIDIDTTSGDAAVGIGGDRVLLYKADGSPVEEFTTITAALAAAVAGDVVQPQADTYVENVVAVAGVSIVGRGLSSVIQGTVTGAADALLRAVRVVVDGDDAGLLYGVDAPETGTFVIEECSIEVDNATGNAVALYSNAAGTVEARRCVLRGVSAAAYGWAAYSATGGGSGLLTHCKLVYTTAPTEAV